MMKDDKKIQSNEVTRNNESELYSIVIPVYNSTNSLEELTIRINKVFQDINNASCEVVFVDDASPNSKTWKVLEDIRKNNRNVKIVQLSRNFGQQAATLCGLEEASGEYVITMDDDLQHLPEDIPKLMAKKNHDLVIAQFQKKSHSIFTRLTSRIKGWFDYKLIGKPKHIQMSPFRLINKGVVDAIPFSASPYPFIPALLFAISIDVVGVPVRHEKEMEGRSNYTVYKRFKIFTNLLINNSSLLLKLIGTFGIWLSALSFLTALWFVYKKLIMGIGLVGWTSTIVAVLFVGGLLLFSVGVIGEYLIRIIAVVERKPAYHIRIKS